MNLRSKLTTAVGSRLALAVGRISIVGLGITLGTGVKLFGPPIVSKHPKSHIHIGDRVVLCSSSRFTALGVNHPVILRTLNPHAELIIGNDVGISGGSICSANSVRIGANTMLGANVIIADTDFHPLSSQNRRYAGHAASPTAPVVIGKNVFIGTGTTILKGVRIGDDCVIGAESVVTKDIPAGMVAAGQPCRVIGPVTA